jgi:hypothetical protein
MRALVFSPLPAVCVGVLVVVVSLPWGGPDWLELMLALIPIASIHFWSVRRPWLLPPLAVFALGLLEDVVMHERLGVWTAAALVAALMGRLAGSDGSEAGVVGRYLQAWATLLVVVCLVGIVTSLQDWKPAAWRTLLDALLLICVVYPLLSALMSVIDGLWRAPEERSLLLRGD